MCVHLPCTNGRKVVAVRFGHFFFRSCSRWESKISSFRVNYKHVAFAWVPSYRVSLVPNRYADDATFRWILASGFRLFTHWHGSVANSWVAVSKYCVLLGGGSVWLSVAGLALEVEDPLFLLPLSYSLVPWWPVTGCSGRFWQHRNVWWCHRHASFIQDSVCYLL